MNDNVVIKENSFLNINKASANGVMARIFLAFLTTAGIFYVNIMPAIIDGLKDGAGFTDQQAGFVGSANLYGAAFGALLAVFIIKKINWQRWSYALLVAILAIDFVCIYINSPTMMIAIRALHGITGGLLVGIGFGIISRTSEADKTFGYLLLIQWSLGGLGIMFLPGLVPEYGTAAMFISLMVFTVVTLMMLPFLGDYPIKNDEHKSTNTAKIKRLPLMLTLFAIFMFQGANMGLFAYVIGLAKAEGLMIDFISTSLGLASWIALFGAFLVIVIGTKYGRTVPIIAAIVLTAISTWLLHFSESANVYLIANIIIGITWAFILPYLFGICSELDKAGQMAALGGFASKMGLASGPMVAALFLGNDNYGLLIDMAAIGLVICAIAAFYPARLLDTAK
ncbi:MFS transporter [Thalassotalea crassostreae]|uniref:MFS transporter n=1 Tax=Thalassotalea crassostreae TaxID=1763536 RepID=UPI00083994E1|nr:MFS transporter [Thalassotalea crassostreae]